MDKNGAYVNDGTVDFQKKPANKAKTGGWKACRFILGMVPKFPFIKTGS